jgi:hypothetical protein
MRTKGWDVIVVSLPEYQKIVVEVYLDAILLATLDREDPIDQPYGSFYGDDGKSVRLDLDELIDTLKFARAELMK